MIPESTTADFLPTRATIWISYFLDSRNLEKKPVVSVRLFPWKNIRNRVIDLHAIYSRILANLPVRLSRALVNLPVKAELTRTNPMGAMGGAE